MTTERYGKDWDGTAFANFVGTVEDDIADSSVKFFIGRDKLSLNAGPRRVVFTTSQSPLSGTRRPGGKLFPDDDDSGQIIPAPRPTSVRATQIYSLDTQATVHVFAENGESTELLAEQLLVSMRELFGAETFVPRTFTWTTDQPGEVTGSTKRGPKISIDFTVRGRINGERKTLTRITGQIIESYEIDYTLEPA